MDNQNSSGGEAMDEEEYEYLKKYFESFINDYMDNDCQVNNDTVIMISRLCDRYIIQWFADLILDRIAPQVHQVLFDDMCKGYTDDFLTPRNTFNVTEDNVRDTMKDGFHLWLSDFLGIDLERSSDSDALMELMAVEVTNKVNRELKDVTATSSKPAESKTSTSPVHVDMVYHIIQILKASVKTTTKTDTEIESIEDEECLDRKSSTGSVIAVEEPPHQNKTFLVVFLGKLLDHIAESTKTSLSNVDIDRMVGHLRDRTEGHATFPPTVGNIHIPIYKKLRRQFGSAKMLRAAMMCGDEAFDEAVARALKAQLLKTSGNNGSFGARVKRIFTKWMAAEDIATETGSTPSPGMFRSVGRFLMKPFTCCSNT